MKTNPLPIAPSNAKRRWEPRALLYTLLLATCASLLFGCSAEYRKARHTKRADAYYDMGRYKEAAIEYSNVLSADPGDVRALRRLGISRYELGHIRQAAPLLVKAHKLAPEDHDVGLRLGRLLLASRRVDDARQIADSILSAEPRNFDAQLLWAGTADTVERTDEAIARLKTLEAGNPDPVRLQLVLGSMHMRKKDLASARACFEKAIELDPDTGTAYLAMGDLLALGEDQDAADEAYRQAADLSPLNSRARIRWILFKLKLGKADEAKQMLDEILAEHEDYLPARYALAEIAFAARDYESCLDQIETVLKKQPENINAYILRGQVRLAMGLTEQVIEEYTRLLNRYPNAGGLRYQYARTLLYAGRVTDAMAELEKALQNEPELVHASLLLAELRIRTRDYESAVDTLKDVTEKFPKLSRAHLLLGTAYRAQREFSRAVASYSTFADLTPDNPQGHYLEGLSYRGLRDNDAAIKSFEQSLQRSPGFVLPLAQIVDMAIADQDLEKAYARLHEQTKIAPEAPGPVFLLGRLQIHEGKSSEAEQSFLKVIEMEPRFPGAYQALSRIYIGEGRVDEALEKARLALQLHPDDLGSLMLKATVLQQQGDVEEAKRSYELVLARNPRFAAAANNLSYLYLEYFDDTDKALDLAQQAKELAPDDPYILDSLGWVLYRKGEYAWALSVLKESAEGAPEHPEIQYHLGMAFYGMGMEDDAEQALARALAPDRPFRGIDQARSIRDVLALDVAHGDPTATREKLNTVLSAEPENLAALTQLARLHERAGERSEAARVYERVLANRPEYTAALKGLALCYSETPGKEAKGLELAKTARRIQPEDPDARRVLGIAAYHSGEYSWSASLLQEAFQAGQEDDRLTYTYACALLANGDLAQARDVAERCAASDEYGQRVRCLKALAPWPGEAQATPELETLVDAILADHPNDQPALLARASLHWVKNRKAEARAIYEALLERSPQCIPAACPLAFLLHEEGQLEEASEWASKARRAQPGNPWAADILGRVAYAKSEFERAVRLLEEASQALPLNAERSFLLGMSLLRTDRPMPASEALKAALAADPGGAFAGEARDALSSLE
jgi:tetratricopeptide (TPR) repeat protein